MEKRILRLSLMDSQIKSTSANFSQTGENAVYSLLYDGAGRVLFSIAKQDF